MSVPASLRGGLIVSVHDREYARPQVTKQPPAAVVPVTNEVKKKADLGTAK